MGVWLYFITIWVWNPHFIWGEGFFFFFFNYYASVALAPPFPAGGFGMFQTARMHTALETQSPLCPAPQKCSQVLVKSCSEFNVISK